MCFLPGDIRSVDEKLMQINGSADRDLFIPAALLPAMVAVDLISHISVA